MEDNFGLIGIITALLVLSILRGCYGRITSSKAQLEEFFTYIALIGFVVAFSLVVGRSPEGRQRYQSDMDLYIPIKLQSVPASPLKISQQLSSQSKATPDQCSTCHTTIAWEAFRGSAAIITKDTEANYNTVNLVLKPLQSQVDNKAIVIRSPPGSGTPKVGWSKIISWFSQDQRESRKHESKALQAENSNQTMEDRISNIQENYDIELYRQSVEQLLSLYAAAESAGNAPLAAYHLLQASRVNTEFYTSLAKSSPLNIKAGRAIFMLDWGAWVVVVVSLITRYLIRRLNPDASWFIYPGITICWGLGICLMTDYSLNYLHRLRFIGFYVWRDVVACHLIFILITLVLKSYWCKAGLVRALEVARHSWSKIFLILFAVISLACVFVPAHVASEVIKMLLVVFFAWYAVFRGEYIARRTEVAGLLHNISDPVWLKENIFIFILFTGLGGFAFIYLHDFGPLLVIIILLCTYIWLLMGVGTVLMAGTIAGTMVGVAYYFRDFLGRRSIFAHIYERFSEMYDPFHLGSGELSKLLWLRKSAGMTGYSFGNIPYFGHYPPTDVELLVTPAQLQSDYSTSHVFTQIGYPLGVVFMLLYFAWFLKIFIDSGQLATKNEASDSSRFIGWFLSLASLLLLIQAILTTAGGFTVVPLTGITLPLISFGTTSAICSSIIIAVFYAKEEII